MPYKQDGTEIPHAEITARKRVYDGFFKMDKLSIRQTGPSGEHTYTREVFERGHSVAVLLYDPVSDQVALIEELRAGPLAAGLPLDKCRALGVVAGGIEARDGESPEDAARQTAIREVEEEAGIVLCSENLYGPLSTMVSPGGTSEVIHHFIACVDLAHAIDGSVHGLADENEEIITRILSREEARALVGNGIQNGLAITLLILLDRMIENGLQPDLARNSGQLMDQSINMDL